MDGKSARSRFSIVFLCICRRVFSPPGATSRRADATPRPASIAPRTFSFGALIRRLCVSDVHVSVSSAVSAGLSRAPKKESGYFCLATFADSNASAGAQRSAPRARPRAAWRSRGHVRGSRCSRELQRSRRRGSAERRAGGSVLAGPLRGPRGPRPRRRRGTAPEYRARGRGRRRRARARARGPASILPASPNPPPARAPDRDRGGARAPRASPRGGRFSPPAARHLPSLSRRARRGSRTVGPRPTPPPAFQTASDLSRRAETSWLDVGASEKPCVAEEKNDRDLFRRRATFLTTRCASVSGATRARVRRPGSRVGRYPYKPETLDPPPVARRVGWVPRRRNVRRARIRGRVPVAKTPPRPRRRLRAPRRDAKYFASREIEFGDVFAREISRRAYARRAERLRAAHGPARGSTGHGNGPVRAKVRKPEPARDAARGGGAPRAASLFADDPRDSVAAAGDGNEVFLRHSSESTRVETNERFDENAGEETHGVGFLDGCSSTPWTTSSGPRRKKLGGAFFARLRARQRRAAHNPTHAQAGYRARSRRARVRAAIDRELALRRRPAHQQGAAHRAPAFTDAQGRLRAAGAPRDVGGARGDAPLRARGPAARGRRGGDADADRRATVRVGPRSKRRYRRASRGLGFSARRGWKNGRDASRRLSASACPTRTTRGRKPFFRVDSNILIKKTRVSDDFFFCDE